MGCIKLFTEDKKLIKKVTGIKIVSSKKQGLDLVKRVTARSTLDGNVCFVEMHNKRKQVIIRVNPVAVCKNERMLLEPAEEL